VFSRRPPGLLIRSVAVTFVTASVLLAIIFGAVLMTVRDQVRETIRRGLDSSQKMLATVQEQERHELQLQATNAAESSTLKAAVDTYAAEYRQSDDAVRAQLLNTMRGELEKVASRVRADAIVVVDARRKTLAAAGPYAEAWPIGQPAALVGPSRASDALDGVVHIGTATFRVVTAPLLLTEGTSIGSLYVATSLDQRFAQQLADLARTATAIVSGDRVIASTLPPSSARELEGMVAGLASEGTLELDGKSHAFQRLFLVGDTSFYAVTSLEESARAALTATTQSLFLIGIGAMGLALLASIGIAHHLSAPIGRLSASLRAIAGVRKFDTRLPLAGSSRELDELTGTFNALMASVTAAEAETEAAYTAAIRALAAALDARDPYTAGHSERVSVLSVATGRAMNLPAADLEVLRLGALLHDIGKIGVPDEVLRKPGPLTRSEFETIKQHTVLGARILRTVPFLAPHVPIVELHHERLDGRGYPHGLVGDATPLLARIVHVADAYDAMTSARAYRRERPASEALAELQACVKTDFDPDVVNALVTALPAVTLGAHESIHEHLEANVA
jgi:putative nucleotidyltransferase with HDIG domain